MKKILCDKDGKFLSVHDGDCLTHEDGTIMIYRERKCKKDISKAFYHVYLRNNELHFLKTGMSFSYYDFIPSFRFFYRRRKEAYEQRACRKRLVLQYKEQMYRKNSVACQEELYVLLH